MIKVPSIPLGRRLRYAAIRNFVRAKLQSAGPPERRFVRGVVYKPGPEAIAEACRRLDVNLAAPNRVKALHRSIGAIVAEPGGTSHWLKVSGYQNAVPDQVRKRALSYPRIAGVPMPSIVRNTDWRADDVEWLGIQMTLAPSPPIEKRMWASGSARGVSDQWIASLKDALDALGTYSVATHYSVSPGAIQNLIVPRWGERAPYVVDEWRFAHGDLQWSNLTGPNLMLIDWSDWGLAPRGFDAAKLVIFAVKEPDLVRRIEAAFAEDLASNSGRIALLVNAARKLREIERKTTGADYYRLIQEKAEQILSGP